MYTENREAEVVLLKKLWCREPVTCPKCPKATLVHLHKKAKKPQYFVVFLIGGKKRSFRIFEFSYGGHKRNERGTLKYKGD